MMAEPHREKVDAQDVHQAISALRKDVKDLRADVKDVRDEVSSLKSKSRLWGAVSGALTAIGLHFLP